NGRISAYFAYSAVQPLSGKSSQLETRLNDCSAETAPFTALVGFVQLKPKSFSTPCTQYAWRTASDLKLPIQTDTKPRFGIDHSPSLILFILGEFLPQI